MQALQRVLAQQLSLPEVVLRRSTSNVGDAKRMRSLFQKLRNGEHSWPLTAELTSLRHCTYTLMVCLGAPVGILQSACSPLEYEEHLVFACSAMQCVRHRCHALFSPAESTMQLLCGSVT